MKRTMIAAALPVLVLLFAAALGAHSQSLPLGSIFVSDPIGPCSGASILNHAMFGPNMTCSGVTVTCPNTQSLSGTFGWYAPANSKGTVVLFSSGAGTSPSENFDEDLTYATDYENYGFTVLQIEWDSAWEDPNNGAGGSPLAAACRPATFLNWVNNSSALRPSGTAMCAQGSSAGTTAIAYPLVWYGAGSYLTNVELLSGPSSQRNRPGLHFS